MLNDWCLEVSAWARDRHDKLEMFGSVKSLIKSKQRLNAF